MSASKPSVRTPPSRFPEGRSIRAIRESLGWSRNDLSRETKLARQTVFAAETGWRDQRPTLETLERVASTLGCDVATLLTEDVDALCAVYRAARDAEPAPAVDAAS
jgi:transcriptional regulator with XRE-family HTH domain